MKKRYYAVPFLFLSAIYLFVAAYNINWDIRSKEWTPFEEGYRVGDMYWDLIEQDIANLRPQLVLTMILGTTTLLAGIILLIPGKKSKEKAGGIVSMSLLLMPLAHVPQAFAAEGTIETRYRYYTPRMNKMVINTKKKQELITIIFLSLAATSFAVAGWYFWRANGVPDAYNRSYEEWRNSGLPFGMPPDWDRFYDFMLAWQKAGVGFTFLGLAFSTLAFTCYKQTRKIAVMILILLAATFAAPQTAAVSISPTGEADGRWWVYHKLLNHLTQMGLLRKTNGHGHEKFFQVKG